MQEIITAQQLIKSYDGTQNVLNGLNFAIRPGEWTNIMGPSGSGKTTLLNILSGLDKPTGGAIIINGVDISHFGENELARFRRENLGLVFQQYHLLPFLTALENIMLAQHYHSVVDEQEAREVLTKVGLGHRLDHRPAHMSGGEQQRVCIARALVNRPKLILADEPTGNLDQKNSKIVLDIFGELHAEGHTIVMVTHAEEIGKMGDRLLRLLDGQIIADICNSDGRRGEDDYCKVVNG
ncbi:ABC transporter ATP-binding protein [Sporomusa sp.]|uniref:ABC transporter ATP-binding protein n=1 Tax=Sporomusa sp. TaxID=2078658 RepID=UPI002C18E770|nr:ABC transporter ATP-binding protein [Sporomusa sp.]HWR45441.1 ABC transporter ATP-binding protein [Sporomusa sp.]